MTMKLPLSSKHCADTGGTLAHSLPFKTHIYYGTRAVIIRTQCGKCRIRGMNWIFIQRTGTYPRASGKAF